MRDAPIQCSDMAIDLWVTPFEISTEEFDIVLKVFPRTHKDSVPIFTIVVRACFVTKNADISLGGKRQFHHEPAGWSRGVDREIGPIFPNRVGVAV
jgi:hypothetical protein